MNRINFEATQKTFSSNMEPGDDFLANLVPFNGTPQAEEQGERILRLFTLGVIPPTLAVLALTVLFAKL